MAHTGLMQAQDDQTLRDVADQPGDAFYFTSGMEYILSFANVKYKGKSDGSALRFAPVFNIQGFFNYDINTYSGLIAGVAVHNVGFIYDFPDSDIRRKFRTYNIGIPLGVKLGNMDRSFLYAGYEMEIPVHYKEKLFVEGDKQSKKTAWFSQRVNPVQSALFVGVQLPYATNIRFKFYLSEFFNRDFTELDDGVEIRPYEDLEARVFYISFSFNPFRVGNSKVSIDVD